MAVVRITAQLIDRIRYFVYVAEARSYGISRRGKFYVIQLIPVSTVISLQLSGAATDAKWSRGTWIGGGKDLAIEANGDVASQDSRLP